MQNNSVTPDRYPFQVPDACHPLQVAAQLYYSRSGLELGRAPKRIYELSRKFECAFGMAWECVSRTSRAEMLTYWEEYPRHLCGTPRIEADGVLVFPQEPTPENQLRRVMPYAFPNIWIVDDWSPYDQSQGLWLGEVTPEGTGILFWAPFVEAIPEDALVSVMINALSSVAVYAHSYALRQEVSDEEERREYAGFIRLRWKGSDKALLRWRKSPEGKQFISDAERIIALLDSLDPGAMYPETKEHDFGT